MPTFEFDGHRPNIDPSAWVAPGAQVIGRVVLGPQSSVWFNAVMRGDNEPLILGAGSNVQDGAIIHTDVGLVVDIGERVTVGHQAMLHGCRVGHGSLIGMQATLLNGCQIGQRCLIAAGALVTGGTVIPDDSMVIGRPGKVHRPLTDAERAMLAASAQGYIDKAVVFAHSLRAIA